MNKRRIYHQILENEFSSLASRHFVLFSDGSAMVVLEPFTECVFLSEKPLTRNSTAPSACDDYRRKTL